jgi:hypothetical protein
MIRNAKRVTMTVSPNYGWVDKEHHTFKISVDGDTAIEYGNSYAGWLPREFFKEATQLDKLFIIGGKVPCKCINGFIEAANIEHDVELRHVDITYKVKF